MVGLWADPKSGAFSANSLMLRIYDILEVSDK
jgi:hypothetical protein